MLQSLNPVRFCRILARLHQRLQGDRVLVQDWPAFYNACARAIVVFRRTDEAERIGFTTAEKMRTSEIAADCLLILDKLVPATSEHGGLDTRGRKATVPDEIFRQLASLVSDHIAARFERVQLLTANDGSDGHGR